MDLSKKFVHGGIRHLENLIDGEDFEQDVHGGIRHLESYLNGVTC